MVRPTSEARCTPTTSSLASHRDSWGEGIHTPAHDRRRHGGVKLSRGSWCESSNHRAGEVEAEAKTRRSVVVAKKDRGVSLIRRAIAVFKVTHPELSIDPELSIVISSCSHGRVVQRVDFKRERKREHCPNVGFTTEGILGKGGKAAMRKAPTRRLGSPPRDGASRQGPHWLSRTGCGGREMLTKTLELRQHGRNELRIEQRVHQDARVVISSSSELH